MTAVVPGTSTPEVDDVLRSPGRQMDAYARSFFEPRFGRDFSAVHVHDGPSAAESVESIQARAFTVGDKMVFAAGRYAPLTDSGRRLIAHELTHVVQQTGMLPREPDTSAGMTSNSAPASIAVPPPPKPNPEEFAKR